MALATTATGSCLTSASCSALGLGGATFWAPKTLYADDTKTGTVIVVHIINTVADTTRISTIAKNVPPGFMPPPTNFGGTRTARATYYRHGSYLPTTAAYPFPFVDMPDNYTIIGDYQIASPSGSKKCVRNVNQVFDIPINWQPVWRLNDPKFNLSQFYDPNDELGWSYSYLETSNQTRTYNIKELIDVIPDDNPDMPHSVVKGCNPQTPPQPYAITANPNWKVVGSKSVIYEGNTPATVTKVAEIADADEGSTSTDRGPHSTHTEVASKEATGTASSPGLATPGSPGRSSASKNHGSIKVLWPLWTAAVWMLYHGVA